MQLASTTPPTARAVDPDWVRLHNRLPTGPDDQGLLRMIDAATAEVEGLTGCQLITATYTYYLDRFPSDAWIELPKPPLKTVTSVKYLDTAGSEQTFSASYYSLDTTSTPGRILLAYGSSWPTTLCFPQAVRILYTCGYGAGPSSVPVAAQQAIMTLAGDYFMNRVQLGDVPKGILRLLGPLRCHWEF